MITVTTDKVSHLHLVCDECGEIKTLWLDERNGGHSWAAAQTIADEFDKLHDATCEED